jgi:hypothetical protein
MFERLKKLLQETIESQEQYWRFGGLRVVLESHGEHKNLLVLGGKFRWQFSNFEYINLLDVQKNEILPIETTLANISNELECFAEYYRLDFQKFADFLAVESKKARKR